ncbi:rod shape-determining protein [Endomicrobiia bacterium]|uniref:rod shape-determining protein n=1 Tax=Endomicrobium trichonymphae TaxID=1408204 RepID=UPI00086538EF|nr:rod shape-determining protein [Candidatus Endomicrobium trichonymphae]BAV58676.1 rod shape-determining protein MreB [Candidatus Endomicrobium trichonymphae]GHT22124.1 rod shape-determining protein [Endomicrobiia bacterium]
MFNYIFGLFSNDMGIDLGTASVLVFIKGQNIVLREPSVVAMERDTKCVLAIGVEAKKMLGKTPANIIAVRPLRNGVIADFEATEKMIRYFIRKVHKKRTLLHPRIVIGVPSGITEVERRAVRESAEQAGAREVYLIDEPMAAAIGAGIQIQEPEGSMIVDIGGGTTEVAIISLGGMVIAKSLDIAGDKMDEAIVQYFRRKYNLTIGENTAEGVKMKIGSVFPLEEELSVDVKGRDLLTGLPKTVNISSEEVRVALSEPIKKITEIVKNVLEETPAELSADLIDRGIILSGGGSLVKGLPDLLSKETELPVNRADDPLGCVAKGTGSYLDELDNIKNSRKRRM